MTDAGLVGWLLENGGAVVRYRTATELGNGCLPTQERQFQKELLESAEVGRWLARVGKGPIHHTKDTATENALGKLLEYGLRAGIPEFDARVRGLCDLVRVGSRDDGPHVLAPFLIRAGYFSRSNVRAFFDERLKDLDRTARRGPTDYYQPAEAVQRLPRTCQGKRIYRPEHDPLSGRMPLPSIYDLYALSHWTGPSGRVSIDRIIGLVATDAFQSTPGGYGWDAERHAAVHMGRSFLGCLTSERLVLYLYLTAPFSVARRSTWFQRGLRELERHRTNVGTYRFPVELLKEQPNGYGLCAGAHMGLGEDRRSWKALELESTFWMLKIRRRMEKG